MDTKDLSSLTAYILEALSAYSIMATLPLLTSNSGIDPPFAGVYRVAKQDETIASLTVKQGDRLFLDVAAANMNVSCSRARLCKTLIRDIQEDAFPNPTVLDTTRTPRERYIHGDGCFKILGEDLATQIMAEVLRGILSFDNVRRGPGQSGKLPRFEDKTLPMLRYAYLNEKMMPSAWPTSMVINYDTSA